jgi:hypothetical protein
MALFPLSLEKKLSNAMAARDRLIARLAEAEAAVIALRTAAEQLAIDGATEEALDTAEAKTRAKVDRTATLRAALATSETLVSNLERERNALSDRKQRDETAAAAELLAREIITATKALDDAAATLMDCTARAIPVVYEASGLHNLAKICHTEGLTAAGHVAKLLRVHAAAVLRSEAPATMKMPDAPFVEPIAVEAAVVQLFCMRPVKWRDANGKQVVAQKFTDAELTPQAAKRALSENACVRMNDSLRRQHHGTTPGHADPRLALDLDADPASIPQTAPIQHSAFEPAVVGPARILKIAREG